MVILNLKKRKFYRNIEKVLLCKKIPYSEKNNKYFICYLYNDYKIGNFCGPYKWMTPKVDSNHTCLALISLDSVLKKDDI